MKEVRAEIEINVDGQKKTYSLRKGAAVGLQFHGTRPGFVKVRLVKAVMDESAPKIVKPGDV